MRKNKWKKERAKKVIKEEKLGIKKKKNGGWKEKGRNKKGESKEERKEESKAANLGQWIKTQILELGL